MNEFQKNLLFVFILIMFVIGGTYVSGLNTFMPIAAQVNCNGTACANGHANVSIYNLNSSGSLLYTENFNNSINQGLFQAIVGYQNISLDLMGGNIYWMNLILNGSDVNASINGSDNDRIPFIAPCMAGQGCNVSNSSITGSDTDDALNVTTGGSSFYGAVFARGNLNAYSGDVDDSLNVSNGGSWFGTGFLNINNFFNITPSTSSLRTNGTLTITNTKQDALNVTGGEYIGGNLVVNGTISGSGGLASQNDVTWQFLRAGNLTTDWTQNISGFSDVELHRVDYEFTLVNTIEGGGQDSLINRNLVFFVDNITSQIGYNYRTILSTSVNSFGNANITLGVFDAIGSRGSQSVLGSLYIYQKNSTEPLIFYLENNMQSIITNENMFIGGSYNWSGTPEKFTTLNFFVRGTNSDKVSFNGTYKIYASRTFNINR